MDRLSPDTDGLTVEIVSMLAARAGGEPHGLSWRGAIPREHFDGVAQPGNAELFAFFQRDEDTDRQRLEELGYRLPSLSPDDLIAWGGATYRVLPTGFERLI